MLSNLPYLYSIHPQKKKKRKKFSKSYNRYCVFRNIVFVYETRETFSGNTVTAQIPVARGPRAISYANYTSYPFFSFFFIYFLFFRDESYIESRFLVSLLFLSLPFHLYLNFHFLFWLWWTAFHTPPSESFAVARHAVVADAVH